jgi:hypothetical protein
MQFMLCGNFMNLESLFQCFYSKPKEQISKRNGQFSLVIDKRLSTYPYALKQDNTRVSIVDNKTNYLNTPTFETILPPIFVRKNIKGELLEDVIHSDVAPFYKNLILSTFQERCIVKLHIILNDVHILLTAYPIYDNKKKVICCTLTETPFLDVTEYSEIQLSMKSKVRA